MPLVIHAIRRMRMYEILAAFIVLDFARFQV